MYIACGVSHFIAAKIEYKHPSIDFYVKFAYLNQPAPKPVKGKTIKDLNYEELK